MLLPHLNGNKCFTLKSLAPTCLTQKTLMCVCVWVRIHVKAIQCNWLMRFFHSFALEGSSSPQLLHLTGSLMILGHLTQRAPVPICTFVWHNNSLTWSNYDMDNCFKACWRTVALKLTFRASWRKEGSWMPVISRSWFNSIWQLYIWETNNKQTTDRSVTKQSWICLKNLSTSNLDNQVWDCIFTFKNRKAPKKVLSDTF